MRLLTLRLLALFVLLPIVLPLSALAQVQPSAYVHRHRIYVGGEFALYNSDYFGGNKSLNAPAFSIYGDYYLSNGAWPITLNIDFTKVPNHHGNEQRHLSSFLVGPTVRRRFGRLEPFAKVGVGFGHLSANDAYRFQWGNHFAIGIGGGLDYRLTDHIMLRPLDYTFERWNFSPNALSPRVLGFGLSYRIR